jgi:hypothetical protein
MRGRWSEWRQHRRDQLCGISDRLPGFAGNRLGVSERIGMYGRRKFDIQLHRQLENQDTRLSNDIRHGVGFWRRKRRRDHSNRCSYAPELPSPGKMSCEISCARLSPLRATGPTLRRIPRSVHAPWPMLQVALYRAEVASPSARTGRTAPGLHLKL